MTLRDMFLATLVAAIWGGNFVSVKFGLAQFPPFLLSSFRFIIVGAMLLPFVPVPSKTQLKNIFLLSFVLGALHLTLLFAAMHMGLNIASTAIVAQMGVPFACLLGAIFLKDKLGIYRISGMLLAFGGIAIVAGTPNILDHPMGFLVALFSAFCWGVANILMKRLGDVNIFQFLGWFSLFTIPFLVVFSAVFESSQFEAIRTITQPALLSVLYTAFISTIGGYGLWYMLVRKYPVTFVTPFSLLTPVFGIALGQIFVSETLVSQTVIGGLVAILGVAIIVMRRPKMLMLGKDA